MESVNPFACASAVSLLSVFLLAGCNESAELSLAQGTGPDPVLPEPEKSLIPTVNIAEAVGWTAGESPYPAPGLEVNAFAQDLKHPRWLYVLPNGDVLVAETNAPERPEEDGGLRAWVMSKVMADAGAAVPSPDRISLLRDTDGDGKADMRTIFLDGLHSPFGMALAGNSFYVANTNAVMEFPYQEGDTEITAEGRVLANLPGGPLNHHWTKSLVASADGSRLYVGVGSNSNVAENGMEQEVDRAAILEINRQTGESRVYASGLRNPVGMTWVNGDDLWVVVNERDELGSDLVPDYMTSVTEGGFYGWPYSYYGQHVDKRVKPPRPDLVEQAIKPDYALGPHTGSLGLLYLENNTLQGFSASGMFIGQHGSWNRDPRSGYQVIFVGFENGQPVGEPQPVLTGFINDDEDKAYGRPVGLASAKDGSLLVADDVGNTVWRVAGQAPAVSVAVTPAPATE